MSKANKLERLVKVLHGRNENKFEHEGHGGGTTNREKTRKKNFVMVRKGKSSVVRKVNQANSKIRYDKLQQKKQLSRERRKRRRL